MAIYISIILIFLPHVLYANLLYEYKIKANDQLKKFTQSSDSYIFVQSDLFILQLHNNDLKCANIFKKNDSLLKSKYNHLKNISINHNNCVNYISLISSSKDYLFADCNFYYTLGDSHSCELAVSEVVINDGPEYFGTILEHFNGELNGHIFHALSHGKNQQGFIKVLDRQTYFEKQSVLFGEGQDDVDISIIYTYFEFPYIYLIYQHSLSSSTDEILSFIVQICPDNISNSMVELQISCSHNNQIYTEAVMATLVAGRLFILFRSKEDSIVCVYKQTNIADIILTSIIKCQHEGIGMKGLNFVHKIMTPCLKQNITIDNIYCGQSENYQSIFSSFSPTIERNIYIKEPVSAIFVEMFNNTFYCIYFAISNGDIQKIIWDVANNKISQIIIFQNYENVLQISNASDYGLILLNKNSIIIINKHKCESSQNCSGCILDPHCAWCLVEQKCIISAKSNVMDGVFYDGKCPLILSINHSNLKETKNTSLTIPFSQLINVTFTANNLHAYMKKTKLSCSFGKLGKFPIKDIKELSDENSLISCNIQDKIKSQIKIEQINFDILYGEHDLIIPKKTNYSVEVFSCNNMALNCGQCLLIGANYNCVWCRSETCLHEHDCIGGHFLKGYDGNICPLPTIKSIFPPGGSTMGGTLVTVVGTNLGFSLDDVKIGILGIPCDVMPELEKFYVKTEKIVCKTGALPLLTNVTKGPVSVVVGGRYSARSNQSYTYAIPTVGYFSPTKGPRSGGTKVYIEGSMLDHGNNVMINICNSTVNYTRRDYNVVEFLSPPCEHLSLSHSQISVKIDNDYAKLANNIPIFVYQEDPVVTKIDPNFALYSGGNIVSIRGSNLNSVKQPNFIVYIDQQTIITECRFATPSFLECPTPRLSLLNNISIINLNNSEWLQVDWGLIMDGAKGVQRFSGEEEGGKVLKYGEDPLVDNLPKNLKFRPNMKLEITGQNLRKFHSFTDFVVYIDNVTCKNLFIEKNRMTCDPPNFNENKEIMTVNEAYVVVQLGNLVRNIGTLDYRQYQPFSVWFILAIILPLLIILLIIIVVSVTVRSKKRCCKTSSANKRPKKIQNTAFSPENIALVENDKLQSKIKMDDQQFFLEVVNRIENTRIKNAARKIFVSRDDIAMSSLIGKGNFSSVYYGTCRIEGATMRTALKILEDSTNSFDSLERIVRDATAMSNFKHAHVINVIGVSIGIQKEPIIILRLMPGPDLRSLVSDKNQNFTARQLLGLCQQVAEGMSYLSNLNFTHRKLCARNCLLDGENKVRVSDFGLPNDIEKKIFFSNDIQQLQLLPLKWMALESLENFVFTTKSDVWSFGVLIWELMTRGVLPYPDVDDTKLRYHLAAGKRLRKPKYCPPTIFEMMLDCWLETPECRPNFTDLVNRLEILLNPPRKKKLAEPTNLDDEPLYMNSSNTTPQIESDKYLPLLHRL